MGLTAGGSAFMFVCVILYAAVMGNRVLVEFQVDEKGAACWLDRAGLGAFIGPRSCSARLVETRPPSALVLRAIASALPLPGMNSHGSPLPGGSVIYLRGDVFSRLRLYCTADNYAAVSAMIDRHGGSSAEPSGEPNASNS